MTATTVLIVDDNSTFLGITERFLGRSYPGEVQVVGTASSGEEALSRAVALRPDVVLCDLVLGNTSGFETLTRLREKLPATGLVAVTLLDTASYRDAALMAGADEFVAKGRMDREILPAIQRARRSRRETGPV